MNNKICKHCTATFNLDGHYKQQVGGKINECPSCVEELGTETAVKYLGLTSGEGRLLRSLSSPLNPKRIAEPTHQPGRTIPDIMEGMAVTCQAQTAPLAVDRCAMLRSTPATRTRRARLRILRRISRYIRFKADYFSLTIP